MCVLPFLFSRVWELMGGKSVLNRIFSVTLRHAAGREYRGANVCFMGGIESIIIRG